MWEFPLQPAHGDADLRKQVEAEQYICTALFDQFFCSRIHTQDLGNLLDHRQIAKTDPVILNTGQQVFFMIPVPNCLAAWKRCHRRNRNTIDLDIFQHRQLLHCIPLHFIASDRAVGFLRWHYITQKNDPFHNNSYRLFNPTRNAYFCKLNFFSRSVAS